MKTTTIQIEIPAPPDTHFLLPQEWKGKVKFQEGDLAYDCDRGWKDTRTGVVWHSSGVLAVARPIATPEPAETQPKFKAGDKVKVLTGVQEGTDIATIDKVNNDQSFEITFDDGATGTYDAVNLTHVKLVPWTFDTRPAGMVWVRCKGEKRVTLVTIWDDHIGTAYGSLSFGQAFKYYEWSADGKNNWQPCGNYEPDNS